MANHARKAVCTSTFPPIRMEKNLEHLPKPKGSRLFLTPDIIDTASDHTHTFSLIHNLVQKLCFQSKTKVFSPLCSPVSSLLPCFEQGQKGAVYRPCHQQTASDHTRTFSLIHNLVQKRCFQSKNQNLVSAVHVQSPILKSTSPSTDCAPTTA